MEKNICRESEGNLACQTGWKVPTMSLSHSVNVNWKLLIGVLAGLLIIGMFSGSSGQQSSSAGQQSSSAGQQR